MSINKNTITLAKGSKNNFNDRVFTPRTIAKEIVEWVKPEGAVLEPFLGEGSFYKEIIEYFEKTGKKHNTKNYCSWTEIDKGRDFFKVKEKFDFIITNPPYSIFTDILKKCFEISNNVILLIPHNKIWTSDKRLDMIDKYGFIKDMKRFKVPKKWTAKFPIGAWWIKKGDL